MLSLKVRGSFTEKSAGIKNVSLLLYYEADVWVTRTDGMQKNCTRSAGRRDCQQDAGATSPRTKNCL
jgi:hypothetical protein